MQRKFIAIILSAVVLAGCDTMGESALVGAGAGAVAATAIGGNAAGGALIGAGAGVYCHQTNVVC